MSLQRISHGRTTEDSRAYSNRRSMGNKCQWGANCNAHVKDGSTIVSWFKESASEDGLRTITRWGRPYGRCIGKWRLVCIMQRKNGVPNLYASENTIPAMTGQQSWNRLKPSKNVPKCLEKQPNLDIPSSQVKSDMKPNKIKFWKNFAFSKLIKRNLGLTIFTVWLGEQIVEQKEQTFPYAKFNRSDPSKITR